MARKCSFAKMKKTPKYKIRHRNRCAICGRPRAVYRKFNMCRICLRNLSHRGEVPGVVKSSW